jgi:hypothetical protein
MAFTWGLNIVLLVPLLFSYSKRSRCEAFLHLRDQPWARGVIIEDSHEHDPPQAPLFYWGNWRAGVVYVPDSTVNVRDLVERWEPERRANVVMFLGEEDLEHRIRRMTERTGALEKLDEARPGSLDRLLHWLNPVNRNETIFIYRVNVPG